MEVGREKEQEGGGAGRNGLKVGVDMKRMQGVEETVECNIWRFPHDGRRDTRPHDGEERYEAS